MLSEWVSTVTKAVIGLKVTIPKTPHAVQLEAGEFGADPNYDDREFWMSRGDGYGPGEMLPEGVENVPNSERKADCFFVHPTGYCVAPTWNMPLASGVRCEDTAKWTNSRQASAFSGSCRLYCPLYRQACIASFLASKKDGQQALEFAYRDVREAFHWFLEHRHDHDLTNDQGENARPPSPPRPIVIAAHSQGGWHILRLLQEEVEGTPLAKQIVGVYCLGCWAPVDLFANSDDSDGGGGHQGNGKRGRLSSGADNNDGDDDDDDDDDGGKEENEVGVDQNDASLRKFVFRDIHLSQGPLDTPSAFCSWSLEDSYGAPSFWRNGRGQHGRYVPHHPGHWRRKLTPTTATTPLSSPSALALPSSVVSVSANTAAAAAAASATAAAAATAGGKRGSSVTEEVMLGGWEDLGRIVGTHPLTWRTARQPPTKKRKGSSSSSDAHDEESSDGGDPYLGMVHPSRGMSRGGVAVTEFAHFMEQGYVTDGAGVGDIQNKSDEGEGGGPNFMQRIATSAVRTFGAVFSSSLLTSSSSSSSPSPRAASGCVDGDRAESYSRLLPRSGFVLDRLEVVGPEQLDQELRATRGKGFSVSLHPHTSEVLCPLPPDCGRSGPFFLDYHMSDFGAFWFNIRKNVADRLHAFEETRCQAPTESRE